MKSSCSIVIIWLALFLVGLKWNITLGLCGKGLDSIGREYYRFVTGLFLHRNFIHLLANASALLFLGFFMETQTNNARLLAVSIAAAAIGNIIFACIYRSSEYVGGSPIVFAMIGFLVACQLFKDGVPAFRLGTWYGNWTLAYVVLANLPFFSKDASTIVIHILSLAIGFVITWAAVLLKIV